MDKTWVEYQFNVTVATPTLPISNPEGKRNAMMRKFMNKMANSSAISTTTTENRKFDVAENAHFRENAEEELKKLLRKQGSFYDNDIKKSPLQRSFSLPATRRVKSVAKIPQRFLHKTTHKELPEASEKPKVVLVTKLADEITDKINQNKLENNQRIAQSLQNYKIFNHEVGYNTTENQISVSNTCINKTLTFELSSNSDTPHNERKSKPLRRSKNL